MNPTSIPELLAERVASTPEKPYILTEDRSYTYREVDELSDAFASNLVDYGIRKGDHVGFALGNSVEYLVAIFGMAKLGGVAATINPEYSARLLEFAVDVTDSELLFYDETTEEQYRQIREDVDVPAVAVNTEPVGKADRSFDGLLDGETTESDIDVSFRDPVHITFSSGTTGDPKPILLSQNYFLKFAEAINANLDVTETDRFFGNLTMSHGNPYIGIFCALVAGGSMALGREFSATSYWDEVRRYDATVLVTHVTTADILLKNKDDTEHDAHSAAFIAGTQAEGFLKKFGLDQVLTAYGSMEAGGLCTMEAVGLPEAKEITDNCVGPERYDFSVRIVDEFDDPLPPGDIGEIVVRPQSPHIMFERYYNLPRKTLEVFTNLWYHSGDLGYKDEEGRVHFVGRKGDSIRVKGHFVPVERVETVIKELSDVEDCVLVGVPSEIVGDDVKAYIKPERGRSIPPERIIEYCEENLADYMVPRYVEFVDEFPRSESLQKIQRNELADRGVGDAWTRNEYEP